MKSLIITDLTLAPVHQENEIEEDSIKAKAVRYLEGRMNPQAKVEYLVSQFDKFLDYNPEYLQNGTIQISAGATVDIGAFQLTSKVYVEDMLVSRYPLKGAKCFVGTLSEGRNCHHSNRRTVRCHYSETYYMSVSKDEDIILEKLLGNDDWLNVRNIDHAFKTLADKKKGELLGEKSEWYNFSYGGLKEIARQRYYKTPEGEKRCLLCLPNSGTLLDVLAFEVVLFEKIERVGTDKDIANQCLRFRMISDEQIVRVSSDNSNYNYAF